MQGGDRGLSLSPAGSLLSHVSQMGEGFGFRQLSNFSRGKKKSKKLVSTLCQTRTNFFNMSLSLSVKIVVVQQSPSCPPLSHQKGGTSQI